MIIRKLLHFEGAHIVRNCSSERCKKSIHGHSYIVELFFTSDGFDSGQMVLDFGLFKGPIKEFVDSFDHSYSMWNKESEDFKTFMKINSDRWVSMPCSPSAESYALMFLCVIDRIIMATQFNNGEKKVRISSVRVHETATGYAEAFREDLPWVDYTMYDIEFSEGIKREWTDPDMFKKLIKAYLGDTKCFVNPVVEQQI
jgi:6-pyruvoyltetrahydropterin/6-carboxytetrahydropterin synthase